MLKSEIEPEVKIRSQWMQCPGQCSGVGTIMFNSKLHI